jgi:ribose-phosphate pyrophosphokinase
MVVDDLCDGGGTFLGIAEAIRKIDENAKISISLIHMVNRKGIENLSKTFDNVFFTNSYKDWDNLPENCKMYNILG